jgi:hypothetical protein
MPAGVVRGQPYGQIIAALGQLLLFFGQTDGTAWKARWLLGDG